MDIITYAWTAQGGREHNEDYFGYYYADGKGVWVVTDGLGGHSYGEIASRLITEAIITQADELRELTDESLIRISLEANRRLLAEQEVHPALKDMKTTLVAAFVRNGLMKIIHTGDSRFYYFNKGNLSFCTKDHSLSRFAVDSGEISFEDIRYHEDRNIVLKVMGLENLNLKNTVDSIEIAPGDAFLLCTDGFWEYVLENEMAEDLSKAANPQIWYERMRDRLLSRAPANNDNFTAICSFIIEV